MLRIPMARSNPRKELKHAKRPLGNLPLEILTFLSGYLLETFQNETFSLGIAQMHTLNAIRDMHSILATVSKPKLV
jgi:putative membrane protein